MRTRVSGVPIQITSMPFFLVDVDGQIAQLRASVHFDNDKIESSFKEHTRHIQFTNPYRQAIGGMVKLKAPPGWTLNPPTMSFSLNPGETLRPRNHDPVPLQHLRRRQADQRRVPVAGGSQFHLHACR